MRYFTWKLELVSDIVWVIAASLVYNFFDKLSGVSGVKSMPNEQFANEVHGPIVRMFKRSKVYSSFKDIIWGAELVNMQLKSKWNWGIIFFSCVINIFSKYPWVVPLKDKKCISTVNAFQTILNNSAKKPRKIWLIKVVNSIMSLLKNAQKIMALGMYSTYNEGNYVVAERFIRTLKYDLQAYESYVRKTSILMS